MPSDVPLRLLTRNVANMGHLLNRCSSYHDLAALLYSRLVYLQELSDLCQAFSQDMPRPYLPSWHPLPDVPDPALIRTLRGHIGGVRRCAISPAGDYIVSPSGDRTLKVWDARTGRNGARCSGIRLRWMGVRSVQQEILSCRPRTTRRSRYGMRTPERTGSRCAGLPFQCLSVRSARRET